jgi:hypothetical protein
MGWIVRGHLLEDSFYIRKGQETLPVQVEKVSEEHGLDSEGSAAGRQLLHQDRTGEHFLSKWNR